MRTIARTRVRVRVDGVVQGVGFRPFVHRLAREHALSGWVRNDERGVLLEVEGEADAVERFLERLCGEAPPLAAVERVRAEPLGPTGEDGFRILPKPAKRASRRGRRAGAGGRGSVRGVPGASCSTRTTAATATRSSTAPTAARASRSSAACPTTGR